MKTAYLVKHLKTFLADSHQKLLIGEIDGVPMSYWESYMVEGDIISNYYPYEKGDQGIHLLIGRSCKFGCSLQSCNPRYLDGSYHELCHVKYFSIYIY